MRIWRNMTSAQKREIIFGGIIWSAAWLGIWIAIFIKL